MARTQEEYKVLKELDVLYQQAKRNQDYPTALKILELQLKFLQTFKKLDAFLTGIKLTDIPRSLLETLIETWAQDLKDANIKMGYNIQKTKKK